MRIASNGKKVQKEETEENTMSKYVSPDKRSKKQQKEYHSKQRRTWGNLNPVTRSVPSGKAYNRKKEKERISKEFRDGFGADFLYCKYNDNSFLWIMY